MVPSKEWMNFYKDRLNEKYIDGVEQFLNYAFNRIGEESKIRCPCVKCNNTNSSAREVVKTHLFVHGIMPNYRTWYHHGERFGESSSQSYGKEIEDYESDDDDVQDILKDLYPNIADFDTSDGISTSSQREGQREGHEPNDDAKTFYKLLKDSEQPIYNNCKTSKLSALVNLLYIKSVGRWSNESFDMLLKLLKDKILPIDSTLPESYYEAKKIIADLGLSYEKIDVCENDCMLYWKEEQESDICKICGESRWKEDKRNGEVKVRKNGKRLPKKILRYFPLKPRLQRLFMSRKTASLMRWHHENAKRKNDGVMRHPSDSMAWKSFNELHKKFSLEPRNVRLGLASDGFQPFSHSKTPYSIWPVILIPYNLPPWLCMKDTNFILSMLIPGPHGPGDAIDVYLQPLIEELKELWEMGVQTFDASTHTNFQLHASLLWTINDFPAYANLSGWSTKGKLASPCCNKETCSKRLYNGNKQCYMGHRRYLPRKHKWRNDKTSFDGTTELRSSPILLSGSDVLAQVNDLEGMSLTKAIGKRIKISHEKRGDNWNKKSIFFELPYWSTLLLRHNLDVMHIEKNICDNVVGTIMDLKGKIKDNVQARLDLVVMKIRPELHPIQKGDKLELPIASYTLSPKEKHLFCLFLKQLRVPDGFSSNISQCVNMKDHKITSLKSHDCHVLLQHLLPLGIRGLLPKAVCEPLIELSLFFNSLCGKSLRVDELEQIDSQIPITLCKLEQVFVPSFFDIMEHLPIHLANEAKIGGPVQYRWMYPIEREMYELKQLIRNTAHPEGSIAEGYIAKECMILCSRYLKGMKKKFNRLERNYDGCPQRVEGEISLFSQIGRAFGAGLPRDLDNNEWNQ
ncbi:uncharacterized protein LOC130015557 [Mercurialis annua]|uniref:uncharacterized protein LOC130015557 n=1 Tax=Mercurialis annua TaxID=3986 RepID=UPI0024ADDD2A|nr:uncharacterized protein LOC130015557 [Mercurialis annua]